MPNSQRCAPVPGGGGAHYDCFVMGDNARIVMTGASSVPASIPFFNVIIQPGVSTPGPVLYQTFVEDPETGVQPLKGIFRKSHPLKR